MFKITIKKENKVTHKASFDTEVEAIAWFEREKLDKSFGKNEWVEIIPEVMDDAGNILEPARQINHPAEYTFEIVDITQEFVQEKTKKDKKEKDKKDRILELKNLDWKNVNTVAELKQVVKVLVNEALKDEE